jgi:hypothetical protein
VHKRISTVKRAEYVNDRMSTLSQIVAKMAGQLSFTPLPQELEKKMLKGQT